VSIENLCHNNARRIENMEKTTTKTAKCIQALLEHQGIVVDTEETEATSLTSLTGDGSGRMDTDHEGQHEGGTKRTRHINYSESSACSTNTQNA